MKKAYLQDMTPEGMKREDTKWEPGLCCMTNPDCTVWNLPICDICYLEYIICEKDFPAEWTNKFDETEN